MGADEASLVAHLNSGRFLSGVARDRWTLIELNWPFVLIEVRARDDRLFVLRFDCIGYPNDAPTATLWDVHTQSQLSAEHWPRGGRVSQVFNPRWQNGAALYIPCDRQSIVGHGGWVTDHPWLIWVPEKGLLQYVEAVCEILQSQELQDDAA